MQPIERPLHCKGCPYKNGKTCGTRGPLDAQLVIVGEAAGHQELAKGQPFVGASGQMVKKLLLLAGLPSDYPILWTNAMYCRPPKGPIPKGPIQACRDRLLDELTAYPRKVVICLGASAFKSITERYDLKITSERGKPVAVAKSLGIDHLFPTIHPAFVLRGGGNYKLLKADIAYAISLLNGGSVKNAGETLWEDIQDTSQLIPALNILSQAKSVGIDIETDGPGNGYSSRTDHILIVSLAYAKNKVLCFPPKYLPELNNVLARPDLAQIWVNGKFDIPFLRKAGLPARLDEDAMLRHYALHPDMGGTHNLGAMSGDELGARLYKKDVKDFMEPGKGFSSIPWPQLCERNAKDADYAFQLLPVFQAQMAKKKGLEDLYRNTFLPASNLLMQVEEHGVWVNKKTINELKTSLEAEIDGVMDRIDEVIKEDHLWDPHEYVRYLVWAYNKGYRKQRPSGKLPPYFNPGSWEQAGWLIYERLGLIPPKGYKPNYREETLAQLAGRHRIIPLLLKFKELEKQISTYVDGFIKRIEPDGRIHPSFLIHGTVNGRLACRKPNLQNVPRDPRIKQIIQSPYGRILMEIDYQGAELRTLALLSHDEGLMKVFLEGRNLHDEVVVARYGRLFPHNSLQYIRAKAVNFGIAYGREKGSLAREFKVTESEAQSWIDDWARLYPRAWAYLERMARLPLEGKTLVTPLWRRRSFGLVTQQNRKDTMNEARGFKPQSLASDFTLHTAIEVQPQIDKYDAWIIDLVHDSLLIELPNKKRIAKEVYAIVKRTMENMPNKLLNTIVPFPIDGKVGKRWGQLMEWDGIGDVEKAA